MIAGLMYRNVGSEDQANVEALVEVFDATGTLLTETTESLGTVYSFANAANCRQGPGYAVHPDGLGANIHWHIHLTSYAYI